MPFTVKAILGNLVYLAFAVEVCPLLWVQGGHHKPGGSANAGDRR